MNFAKFLSRSLKTRVTLFTLAIFVTSIWSLAYYAGGMLHADMERLSGEQQFSTVTFIAAEVNQGMEDRIQALDLIARAVTPDMLANAGSLQKFLDQRFVLHNLFNGGVLIYGIDGIAIAEAPLSAGRVGLNYLDVDTVAAALKEGRSTIGRPVMGKRLKAPVIGMTAPIRNAQGDVIGALAGVINLNAPNFLDKIANSRYAKTGGYLLVARQYRLIVTASDKSRVMEQLPAAGINPLLDRFMQGYEGSEKFVNPLGMEVLVSVKGVPLPGWYVAVSLPTEEAFAPIHALQRRMLMATILLTLLAGGLTWWMLRRQLAPVIATAEALDTVSNTSGHPQPLDIVRQDEVGQLIGAFNRVLATLGQREEALQASENRFRTLFDRASDGIVIMSTSGQLVAANDSFARMHGYTAAEMATMSLKDLDTPETFQRVPERMQRMLSGETLTFEVENYHKDGHVFPLEVSSSLILSGGEPLIQSFVRDITERKLARVARASLEAQLRESQKMEAIGTLAGGIAHDFNNVLATILGNVELARQDVHTNPAALQSLDEIRKAGARARDLVQQILSFSRRQPTERKLTSLAPIVEESERLLRATLPARVNLEVHCAVSVPSVLADATLIQQILINLVTNAMQAMRGGPGHIGIRLDTVLLNAIMVQVHPALRDMHVKHPGNVVRIEVRDDGCGMDAPTLARIFEPFFTTKAVNEGTGLGLSVVHGIVETHEGAIEVESEPGKGSTFTIYLPPAAPLENALVADAPNTSAPSAASVSPAAPVAEAIGPPDDGRGRHILYLDDDESLVFLVQRLLERRGFRVSGYTNQPEALAALRAAPDGYDLVVSDYNMPGKSGLDVARDVRAIRADLPVAIASGYIDEALRAAATGAGVRELIFKANTVEDLCDAFARLALTLGKESTHG